jgi:hypothetical protein
LAEQRARQHSAEQNQAAYDTTMTRKASRKGSRTTSRKTSRLASGLTNSSSQSRLYGKSLADELDGLESLEWDESPTVPSMESQGSVAESEQWSPISPRHVKRGSAKPVEDIQVTTSDIPIISASPTGLKQRRHVDLNPIITEGLQRRLMPGDAVRSLSPTSEYPHASSLASVENQERLDATKQTPSPSPGNIHLPPSPPVRQRLKPESTRHTSLPVPAPLQSAPLQSAKRSSFLLPLALNLRNRRASVGTSIDFLHEPPRSQPVSPLDSFLSTHRHNQTSIGPSTGFPWAYSGLLRHCSPTTPDGPHLPHSPHSATLRSVWGM